MIIHKPKSYSIEERGLSRVWIETVSGIPNIKDAKDNMRQLDAKSRGQLRIVRVVRTPVR